MASSSAASSAAAGPICSYSGCQRPCHRDAQTGIIHNYCGRTHAAQAAALRDENIAPPHGICHVCKLDKCEEPVYFDEATGRVHDFCCRSHADQAINMGQHPRSNRRNQQGSSIDPSHKCALPGCTARKYVDPDDPLREFDYCGRSHARVAASRGIEPPPPALGAPDHFGVTFAGGCGPNAYTLSTLTNAHPKYEAIKRQFVDSWVAARKPFVVRVLQVRNPAPVFARYEEYKRRLSTLDRPVKEKRRFHATRMACSFGIDQAQRPCHDDACAVCSIPATSFQLAHARGGPLTSGLGFLRYGRGLYFARASSKSHDYGEASERQMNGGRQRVMFLCKVALGLQLSTVEDRLTEEAIDGAIVARRKGGTYDSVVGLSKTDGGTLNYEENVLYDEAAAVPSYVIVYQV